MGGGAGTGKGTGKSMRKLCRNYPLANYPVVSPPSKAPKLMEMSEWSCFVVNFGTYGLALVNQIFDSDFCLAGVPLGMTFANYESTFSKPRMDKNKARNPFGQTTKMCLTAAGATVQNYESEFPDYEQRFSNYDWRSSTWNVQTTNGPKILLRNQNSRGQRTTTKLRSSRAYSTLCVPLKRVVIPSERVQIWVCLFL